VYILEEVPAFILSACQEDLFMDYPKYRDGKLLSNLGTSVSVYMMSYILKTELSSSPL
jgi:hypothetical protein